MFNVLTDQGCGFFQDWKNCKSQNQGQEVEPHRYSTTNMCKRCISLISGSGIERVEKKQGFNEAPYFYFKSGIAEYFFRVGKSQQWKNELTNEQLKDIENSFSEILQELEYI